MNKYTKIAETLLLHPVGTKLEVPLDAISTTANSLEVVRRGINRELKTAKAILGMSSTKHILHVELSPSQEVLAAKCTIYLSSPSIPQFTIIKS